MFFDYGFKFLLWRRYGLEFNLWYSLIKCVIEIKLNLVGLIYFELFENGGIEILV